MCRDHFNEPFLVAFDLVRLIGYGEDQDDAYIIYIKRGGDISRMTCVGGYTFLDCLENQGQIISSEGESWNDLYRLDIMLELNGACKVKEFILEKNI